MLNKTFFITLLVFINSLLVNAQSDQYPKDYFVSPLNVPLYLAGNFGEIRSNHFHAGIDIKTQQREGLDVFAAADGYVSRINISLYGYGKAIYIAHPNGMTTVYAHLQQFSPEIEEYVKKAQYKQQKFTLTLFPQKGELTVKQKQIIAKSGNTGGSGGPHLHFEIRKSVDDTPINPLLFGFKIKDDIKPILKNVAFYPLNDTSTFNGKNKSQQFKLYGSSGNYSLAKNTKLKARGVIGVGIEAIDRLNGSNNRCGVYSIRLQADSNTIYKHEMEQIPFHLSRYINSHVDFKRTKKHKRRIQKSFLDPNNKLNIYKNVASGGRLYFSKYGHDLHYLVHDAYGNESSLQLKVDYDSVSIVTKDTNSIEQKDSSTYVYQYDLPLQIENDTFSVKIDPYSTYTNLPFTTKISKGYKTTVAPVISILDIYTPLHKKMHVRIKLDSISEELYSKAYAISLDEKGQVISPEGGKYNNGWLSFSTRSFGDYSVKLDTISPYIASHNFKGNGKNFSTMKNISFTIKDEQSGISSYDGYIDNKWVLMEYDKKKKRLWYAFDAYRLERGKHSLKVVITDNVGNVKSKMVDFIW